AKFTFFLCYLAIRVHLVSSNENGGNGHMGLRANAHGRLRGIFWHCLGGLRCTGVTEGQGAAVVQVTRDKTNEEFTEIENNRELADIQATNILSQGFPRHVFNTLNQTRTGKEIWDNVELLMKGSGKSLQQKKEELFDEYERFRAIGNETSSNLRSHATVHDGQIVTKTVQRKALGNVGNTGTRGTQSYGQVTDNKGKLGICYNYRREGHVSRQSPYDQPLVITTINIFEIIHKDAYNSNVDEGPHAAATFMANLLSTSGTNGATTSHVNEVHTNDNQIFDNVNHQSTHEMHQEEHLDSSVESDIDDNTISYHQYQLDSEVQDVPTEVSSVSPGEISMIAILDDLRNQLDGHLKVNQEQSMVNDSLRAELARCKLEIQTLKRNKVKHDLDTTIVQRNKRNAELEQENMLLKSNISQKFESINSLKTESKKVLSEKNDLEERYLEEISCLKNANKVTTEILQKFQQPTQTIPMLTKRPKLATHDLHKIALGSSNPWYAKQAKIAQPTLCDGRALLKPTNSPVKVHDSEESLVQAEVSRNKMSNRPGTIKPINYAELNALYSHFVPQKELSREHVYWLPAEELATQKSNPPKPMTLFIHTHLALSKAFTEQVIPFYEHVKELVQSLDENLVKEVTEFMRVFDELDKEYEQCVLEKKKLQIEKKKLLIQNECLITECIAKDICSIVLASDKDRCGAQLYGFSPCRSCTRESCGNDLLNGFCSLCNSGNSYVYDPNPNPFDCPPDSYHPPHPTYETYSYDSYGNNSQFGYDCHPQFPLNYESEQGYIEKYNSYPYDSSSLPQQYPCCTRRGGPHETCQCDQLIFNEPYCKHCRGPHMNYRCQLMNQDSYNSNSLGFDQPQAPQSPVIHQPPQELSIQEMEDLKQQYLDELKRLSNLEYRNEIKIAELTKNFNGMSIKIRKKEKLLQQEQWAYLSTHPSKCLNSLCCDDDDDEDYTSAITPDEPVLSTEEPDNSLSMGDEHLDTIPAMKSDEVIKSSVEDLIIIPSESEGIPEHICDVPSHDNSSPLNVSKDQIQDFSESNDQVSSIDDDSFSLDNIDYVEASLPDSELVSSEVMEIVIPEETNTFDNSLPEFKTFCFDVEEISSGSTTTHPDLSLLEYEAFYDNHVKEISSGSPTTHSDSSLYASFIFDLSINPFPPAARSDFYEFTDELIPFISPPEYDYFLYKVEPNSGDFTKDVVEDISPTKEPQALNTLPTHPTLQLNMKF
nr:retrovirus-related Pol polyprotein from transposon TNT 1-94 [Tanacetum cinerariifolium]